MNANSLGGIASFLGVLAVIIGIGVLAGVGWFIYRLNRVRSRDLSGMERLKLDTTILAQRERSVGMPLLPESIQRADEIATSLPKQEVSVEVSQPEPRRESRRKPSNPNNLPQHWSR